MEKKFCVTTPIYYVNDKPHIGHAYTSVAADVLARFHKLQGEKTFLLMGADEHGLKIQKKAEEAGKEPQKFVDDISSEFKNLWDKLNIQCNGFIRTTDEKHKKAVQKVLQALYEKGAIYRGFYEGLYCVGCEQFKSENELVNGRCPDHDTVLETVKEECYLLKMADLQDELVEKIENGEFQIKPGRYKKEILSFLKKEKLKDVSISRKNVKWGIPLPFDAEHTTYVWFDAFLSYLTGLGWEGDQNNVPENWPADIQLIGKDILRVHATIWPVMLMHLGIEFPKQLYVHGHLLSGGRKMSKTIGNVIGIDGMLEKFGVDGTRYLLMSAGTFGEDIDVTMERLTEKYNADLANGLGNLVSRIVKLMPEGQFFERGADQSRALIAVEDMNLSGALSEIWKNVREDDKFVEENKPWELQKNDEKKFQEVMQKLVSDLFLISDLLVPSMPETSEKIKQALETKEMVNLFPRIR
ncbi:MAG TPA: methionine--tRNA ligase [Candidatus Bathyarchaeia archaeon]|nr:methionine--tRNA ligase [Candidatus Bathyarchaeia archaeon]